MIDGGSGGGTTAAAAAVPPVCTQGENWNWELRTTTLSVAYVPYSF